MASRKFIQCRKRETTYSDYGECLNGRLDDFCNSSITEDKDGNFIADFLGKTHADLCSKRFPEQSKEYIGRALICIGDQYTKALKKGNTLSSRYESLKNYYFERLDNWGLQQTTITLDGTQ